MESRHFIMRIDSLAYGGRGVGRRRDGKVVFVPMVIPGEMVSAVIKREHKGYVEAEAEEILDASPVRITAPCPHFSLCGGCDWQHIVYPEQVRFKQVILQEQIRAKCLIQDPCFEEPVISPNEYGYRCHAVVQCTYKDEFVSGFFRKLSNSIVSFKECIILNKHCQFVLDQVREVLKSHFLPEIDSLEIHAPREESLARVIVKQEKNACDRGLLRSISQSAGLKGISYFPRYNPKNEHIIGRRSCSYNVTVRGREIKLASSFGGFIQANWEVNQELVAYVIECAVPSNRLLDLYSGAGNFSIPLSFYSDEVFAVEQDGGLVKTGNVTARENGCSNIRFIHGDAMRALRQLKNEGTMFQTIVLDPPREGARDIVPLLPKMKVNRIIYISCNPSTLARDIAILVKGGFSLKKVCLFDMFPHTFHIESVSVLDR